MFVLKLGWKDQDNVFLSFLSIYLMTLYYYSEASSKSLLTCIFLFSFAAYFWHRKCSTIVLLRKPGMQQVLCMKWDFLSVYELKASSSHTWQSVINTDICVKFVVELEKSTLWWNFLTFYNLTLLVFLWVQEPVDLWRICCLLMSLLTCSLVKFLAHLNIVEETIKLQHEEN